MRLLVLTNMYPPHHYGGYELNCQEAVEAMRAAGHEVLVLTSDVEVPGVLSAHEDPALVRRSLELYWHDHAVLRHGWRRSLAVERRNQQELRHAIADFRPDVVSAWAMGALSLGVLETCDRVGLPIVLVIEDDWLIYGPFLDRWANRWKHLGMLGRLAEPIVRVPCRRRNLGESAVAWFASEHTRRGAEVSGGVRFRRSTVGYCPVNTHEFPVGATEPRPEWSWRILHVGRIDERKGIDAVIRALAKLPETSTLDILGRGDESYLDELRQLVRTEALDGRVRFGVADRAELAARYAEADVVAFVPRWAEPFGLVPLEAMACSTPVVASGTGGSAEFLFDGVNCLRVAVDDPDDIASAIERLAADAGLRGRIVEAGYRTVEQLALDAYVERLLAWHEAAADRGRSGWPAERPSVEQALAS